MNREPWTREWYLEGLESYSKYTGEPVQDPKPPYHESEVPVWYPSWLRKYLTTVSRESVSYTRPMVIECNDHDKTVVQIMNDAVKKLRKDIDESGGPEEYFEYDDDIGKKCIDEIYAAAIENAEMDAVGITVGCGGCMFSKICDARTGVIYSHCGDDRDFGEISYRLYYFEEWQNR